MRAKEIIIQNQRAEVDGELASAGTVGTVSRMNRTDGRTQMGRSSNADRADRTRVKGGSVVECKYCGLTHVIGRRIPRLSRVWKTLQPV